LVYSSSALNICTGQIVTINQLAKTILSITDINTPLNYEFSRKGDIRISVGDSSYAKHKLSITAVQPLSQGLHKLINTTKTLFYRPQELNFPAMWRKILSITLSRQLLLKISIFHIYIPCLMGLD
jgi:hypothetical protein